MASCEAASRKSVLFQLKRRTDRVVDPGNVCSEPTRRVVEILAFQSEIHRTSYLQENFDERVEADSLAWKHRMTGLKRIRFNSLPF